MNPTPTQTAHPRKCGVIGLGTIGGGIAECLIRAGHEVYGFDVQPRAMAAVPQLRACASPAEVARCADVVIIAVVHADQAHEVLFGSNGLHEGAHSNLVAALMSTVRVSAVKTLAQQAQAHGFRLIDVAITTGAAPTASGTSGLMAGGDAATIEAVRDVMTSCSSIFSHMGPLGAGMAAKIARNVMQYGAMLAAYEGGQLAEAAGVDVHKLIDVIRTSDPSNLMSTALLQARGTTRPLEDLPDDVMARFRGWAVQLQKDLDAANELAAMHGLDLPGTHVSAERGDQVYGLPAGTTPPTGKAIDALSPNARGRQMMEAVYGVGTVPLPPEGTPMTPFLDATLSTLFSDIWARPGLSMRDRRLLVLGANAQLLRPDLTEVVTLGALINGELTSDQLQEAVLHLAYYIGWPRASALHQGVNAAIKRYEEQRSGAA
jgi:3-hydroxyisobutyrate dehydrogenase-like beta-hydroxyacid dehydrogenase/alkylhydroperoxidase/carboxymuconolactone decarboxylase family protein YurZ